MAAAVAPGQTGAGHTACAWRGARLSVHRLAPAPVGWAPGGRRGHRQPPASPPAAELSAGGAARKSRPPQGAPRRRDSQADQWETSLGWRRPIGARAQGACPGRGPERVVRAEEEPPPPPPPSPLPLPLPPLPRPSGAVSAAPPPPSRPGAAPGPPARVQVRRGPSAAPDGVGRGRPELAWSGRGRPRACPGRGPGRAGPGGDAPGPRRGGGVRPAWAPAAGPGPDSSAAARGGRGGHGVGTRPAAGLGGQAPGFLQAGDPGAGERSRSRRSGLSASSTQRSRPTGPLARETLQILLWSLSEARGRFQVL